MKRNLILISAMVAGMALIAPAASATPPADSPSQRVKSCMDDGWQVLGYRNQGQCVSGAAQGEPVGWNLFDDFRLYPYQANPSPDRLGNPDVWSYSMADDAGLMDPTTFTLLPDYDHSGDVFPVEYWYSPADVVAGFPEGYPFVSNGSPGFGRLMTIHPEDPTRSPQNWVVVGWRAPHAGDVEVVGYLDNWGPHEGPSPSPPDGTDWRLQSTTGDVTTLEASGYLPEFGVLTLEGMTFHVEPGDTLWLLVGPRDNFFHDQLKIELSIIPSAG